MPISQKVSCFSVKSPIYYFHMKRKILTSFQICISVLLKQRHEIFCKKIIVFSLTLYRKLFPKETRKQMKLKLRSIHPEVFLGKGVLKIYSKFTVEHPWRSLISIKLISFLFGNRKFQKFDVDLS